MTRLQLVLVAALVACGTHHDGGAGADGGVDLTGLVSIEVQPVDQTLVIMQNQPATSPYTALGTFADGRHIDISQAVSWTVSDPGLGGFTAADFTTGTSHGGRTMIAATANGRSGDTPLTVKLVQTWNDPGSTLPADPAGAFHGPSDQARAPALVYPNDGVLVPPNLGRLEMHFRPGARNTLFALQLASSYLDLTIYLRCTTPMNGGCIYLPDPQVWSWLAESGRGNGPVTWSLRATDDTGTGVGASSSQKLVFGQDDLTGGIYYWTTTLKAVMRYDFASTTQTAATQYLGTELSGGTCIGCHALSRDGTKMIAEAGGQNDGRTLLLDVATKTAIVPFGSTVKSNFESWKPDGTMYVGVYADKNATNYDLMLFDGTTSALVRTIGVNGSATNPTDHPDWSPNGDRIAYVSVGAANTLQKMYNGEIRSVTNTSGTWSAGSVLVPRAAGKNRYYPAFSPDGARVVFDESTCANGSTGGDCDADTDPSATLFVVDANGGTPTALTNANKPGVADGATTKLTDSFPKWNPGVFARDRQGGRLAWMTFSSTRQYGLRSPPGSGTLLWMVAVDLDAPAGTDPSYPAIALPFQDLATSNHIAQWTTAVLGPIQ